MTTRPEISIFIFYSQVTLPLFNISHPSAVGHLGCQVSNWYLIIPFYVLVFGIKSSEITPTDSQFGQWAYRTDGSVYLGQQ